jgi:hypothetical protein
VVIYALAMPADGGIPGWFIAIFVLVILAGIGSWLYRISVARQIAEDAGLDPDQAARVTMLSKDGMEATYLASALAQRPPATPPRVPASAPAPAPRPKTVEERLRELQSLRDGGLVSEDEFQAQRAKILGSI